LEVSEPGVEGVHWGRDNAHYYYRERFFFRLVAIVDVAIGQGSRGFKEKLNPEKRLFCFFRRVNISKKPDSKPLQQGSTKPTSRLRV